MSKKRKKQGTPKAEERKDMKRKVARLLENNNDLAFSARQIMRRLFAKNKKDKKAVEDALTDLKKSDQLSVVGDGLYKSSKAQEVYTGKVDHVNPKFAFVICDELDDDVWVRTEDLKTAFDGDIVEIGISKSSGKGKRKEGKVIKVLQRSRSEFVGRIEISPKYAFVVPDSKKLFDDFFIPLEKISSAKENDKVIVRVLEWPTNDRSAVAEVVNVLGAAGENDAEIHSILAEFGLPIQFTQKVVDEAGKIKEGITKKEISKRRDLRDITTFTIDPDDAKDFDDALSIQKLPNGNTEVGIHIADVTHYVVPDSILDKEAFHRATSVYLVDRTIPMLPERLSNQLCSLRPNEDKLTFSAVFELDGSANVKNSWFGKSVIYSDRRFTYEEAQERIEKKEGDLADEVNQLNDLALQLRKKRFGKGAINFETPEVKFKLDEQGKPLGVIPKIRKEAHKLVEEFMLLANRRVAEHVYHMEKGRIKKTFVYRTHGMPDSEKLEAFSKFAGRFGHKVDFNEDSPVAPKLNQLIEEIEGKPEENVLQNLAIRSMAKAVYTTREEGHFGLAFEHYAHFTSPIRRYPDVMVHRLLQHYLEGGKSADKEDYEEKCKHASEMEKRSADAERASIKYKQVEFMQDKKEVPFKGIVSGVTDWGIFVELTETKCEGLVRMSSMTDDFYEYDEDNYRIIGKRNKRIITLGDAVVVKVIRTDIDKRTIDLEMAEGED